MDDQTKVLRPKDLGAGAIPDKPAQQQEAQAGAGSRLIGVLLSPGQTFADINRRPTWVFPILLSTLLAIAFISFFNWRVKPDWGAFMKAQIEKRAQKTGTELTADDAQAQAEKLAAYPATTAYVGAVVFPVLSALVAAYALTVGMVSVQADTPFKKIFSVCCWANCAVTYVVFYLVACASLMAKDRDALAQIDLSNPGSVAATNLGVLMPAESSPVLKSLVGSFDIFSVWLIIVLSIGLAATSSSKRMTKAKAARVVVFWWLVFVGIKAGIASLNG
jgi:hypothetical protein